MKKVLFCRLMIVILLLSSIMPYSSAATTSPEVQTDDETGTQWNNSTLHGTLNDNGGEQCNVSFHWDEYPAEVYPIWNYTNFSYFKLLPIYKTNFTNISYQVRIVIANNSSSYGNVSCNAHCQPDFDDIRFVSCNGTEFSYWIENYTVSEQATMWVNISNVSIDDDQKILMFYGNSTCGNNSDGNATFAFFDDFLGSSVDASVWSVGGSQVEVSDSIIRVGWGSTLNQITTVNLSPLYERMKFTTDIVIYRDMLWYGYSGDGAGDELNIRMNPGRAGKVDGMAYLSSNNHGSFMVDVPTGVNLYFVKKRHPSAPYFAFESFDADLNLLGKHDGTTAFDGVFRPSHMAIFAGGTTNPGSWFIDWVFASRYDYNDEPIWGLPSKEQNNTGSTLYITDFNFTNKFTINHDFIDSDLTNFPVLVNISQSIGQYCNDGDSIRFVDFPLKNYTQYYHELEGPWNTTGNNYLWVNLTHIDSDYNTTFYMIYNNSLALSIENPAGVWDANYVGVYHMNESAGAANCFDSTSNANHGTWAGDLPTRTDSKIGYGQYFDGTGDYISLPAGVELTGNDYGTVESWVELDSVGSDITVWVLDFVEADEYTNVRAEDSDDKWFFDGVHAAAHQWELDSINVATTAFTHLTQGMALNDVDSWINGNNDATDNNCGMPAGTFFIFYIGINIGLVHDMDGTIDEFRISDIKRSDAWIKASFDSSNQSTGFMTMKDMYVTRYRDNTTFGYYNSGDTFKYNATGLNPGTLYYYRADANNSVFYLWGEEKYFITIPNCSTNITFRQEGIGVNISWDHGDGYDKSVLVRNSSGVANYPQNPEDGVVVYNGTNNYTVDNIDAGISYYYRVWELAEATVDGNYIFQYSTCNESDKCPGIPIVVTNNTTGLYPTNATLWGYLQNNGSEQCNVSFHWSTNSDFSLSVINYTIDHDFIDSDLTNFPVLVNISQSIGQYCNEGKNIRFKNNTSSLINLNHEVEGEWNTIGENYIWVNITNVNSTTNTTFYMFYNDSTAVSIENPTGVWDVNYTAVYHMNESVGANCFDSTANARHGTYNGNMPIATESKIGYGQYFPGTTTDDNISLPAGVSPATAGTVEAIVRIDDFSNSMKIIEFTEDSNNWLTFAVTVDAVFGFDYFLGGGFQFTIDSAAAYMKAGVWQFVTGAYQTNDAIGFRNTSIVNTDNLVTGTALAYNNLDYIGITSRAASSYFDGIIDEVRVSNMRRNNSWINATFHSSNQTTGFLTSWKGTSIASANNISFGYYNSSEEFSYNVTGLQPGTVYYYIADANNSVFTVYGSKKYFLTPPNCSTNLTFRQVGDTSTANISWDHGSDYDKSVLVRNASGTPGYPQTPVDGDVIYNSTNNYTTNALTPGFTYYYRVWELAEATVDGNYVFSFSTCNESDKIGVPIVITNGTTGVNNTNATLWGYLQNNGSEQCNVSFHWSTNSDFSLSVINYTIDHDFIDSDLTNFPVLVNISQSIGQYCNEGKNIRFKSSIDASTNFSHEVEGEWNTTGDNYIWVNVTSVTSATNTTFYMIYNDSSAVSIEDPAGVWDANYVGVYHMNESAGAANCFDSTSNANHGTWAGDLPTRAISKVRWGQYLDGAGDYITLPAGVAIQQQGAYEIFTQSDNDGNAQWIIHSGDAAGANYRQHFEIRWDIGGTRYDVELKWVAGWSDVDDTDLNEAWQYYILNFENGFQEWRRNTTQKGSSNINTANFAWDHTIIGANGGGVVTFEGVLDELRISNIRRSTDWLKASFNSSNQTTGFLTWKESGVASANNISFGYYNSSEEFSYNVTGLQPGTVYYYIADANNSVFTVYGEQQMFLTAPNQSLYFNLTNTSFGFNVTWVDDGSSGHLLRYDTTGYPATINDGYFLYNGTNQYYNHSVPNTNVTYYYRMWDYAEGGGLFTWYPTPLSNSSLYIGKSSPYANGTTLLHYNNSTLNGWLKNDGGASCNVTFFWDSQSYRTGYENYTGGSDSLDVYGTGKIDRLIRIGKYSTNESFYLTRVRLNLSRTGNPGDMIFKLRFRDPVTGEPRENVSDTNVTIDANTFSTNQQWIDITFPSFYVQQGKEYLLQIENPGGDAANYVNWHGTITAIFPGPPIETYYKSDGDASWIDSCNHWLSYEMWGVTNTTASSYSNNTTLHVRYGTNDAFSNLTENLLAGHRYFYRVYANSTNITDHGWSFEDEYVTRPNMSTNISLVHNGSYLLNLTWIHGDGYNTSVLVRSDTNYPTSPTDGVVLYNGTNNSYTDNGLTPEKTYYYRVWEYAEWNTSFNDTVWAFSEGNNSTSYYLSLYPTWILNATLIQTGSSNSSAYLHCRLDVPDEEYKVGFWIGYQPLITDANCQFNVTATNSITKTAAQVPYEITFPEYPNCYIDTLTSGVYYYIRSWSSNATNFNVSKYTCYFLTPPRPPTGITSSSPGGSQVDLNWIKFPNVPAYVSPNITTVVRYSDTAYPTDVTGGDGSTFAYNGTSHTTTVSGLTTDTTYYFSLWTYTNDSGSPLLQEYSDYYSTTEAETEGGNYTFHVRYENVSYDYVPFANGQNQQFIIYYSNRTEFNYWDGSGKLITSGTYQNESEILWDNSANGIISVNCSQRPLWVEFHWNDTFGGMPSGLSEFRCNRIVIPQIGQKNVTFYIRTNLPVFRESVFTINGTLVKYAYSFVDETGKFNPNSNALAEIFFYDSIGNKLIVHSEYWDTELKVYPWLVYGKRYFVGVYCDELEIANLGIAPAEQNEEPQVTIPFEYTVESNFWDYINLNITWSGNSIVLEYLDTDYSSINVTIRLYHYNGTLIDESFYTDTSHFTHTWAGQNSSRSYKVEVIVTNDILDEVSSGYITVFGQMSLSITKTDLDDIIQTIFGQTPMYSDVEGTRREVDWTYVIIFGICFVLLTTLGKLNAFLGMSITGGFLMFSSIAITGSDFLPGGAVMMTIGIFLIALAIIGLLGGVERR